MNRAVSLEPMRAEYRVTLGTTLGQIGSVEEAIAALQKALSLDSNSKSAYYALGGVENSRGNYQAALEAFEEALTLDPSDLDIRNSRAKELIFLERFDEAIRELTRIVVEDATLVAPRMNLAVALYNRGDAQEAVAACADVLRRWPGYRSARDLMAVIYDSIGESDRAQKVRSGDLP